MAKQVRIFDGSYEMPTTASPALSRLGQRVLERGETVRSGTRGQAGLRGLLQGSKRLSDIERFEELEHLVDDYQKILAVLHQNEAAYERFFAELTQAVSEGVSEKGRVARQLEQRRRELAREALFRKDQELLARVDQSERRLFDSVRLMGRATLLILKKIALCRKGMDALARDQEQQRLVLNALVDKIKVHKRMLVLEQQIGEFEQEVAEMTDAALSFEEYMRDYFGPLQSLIEQVTRMDHSLHRAVEEIQAITEVMVNERGAASLPGLGDHEPMLDFLMRSELRRGQLEEILASTCMESGDSEAFDIHQATGTLSVESAIDNIRDIVALSMEREAGSGQEPSPAPKQPRPLPPTSMSPPPPVANRQRAPIDPATRSQRPHTGPVAPQTATATVARVNRPDTGLTPRINSREVLTALPLEMLPVAGGPFMMGSPDHEEGRNPNEGPLQEVVVSDFLVGSTPVTQELYQLVNGSNPSQPMGDRLPVNSISWLEAALFCNRLSEFSALEPCYNWTRDEIVWDPAANGYRLPTEAEWEFAARAGSPGPYVTGCDWATLSHHACYQSDIIQPVAERQANAWGLFDVLGNVWEWCWDWYVPRHDPASSRDPQGPPKGSQRVIRGGCHLDGPALRLARREGRAASTRDGTIGLRCVRNQGS